MHKKMTLLWFLLGLGYKLQVVASLSITEIIVLVSAPYLLLKHAGDLRRDGIMPFFVLSILVVLGCIIGSIANHTPTAFVLRGLAVTSLLSCSIVFAHWILRRDPGGFKWFILGLPISAIISTFYFKSSVEMTMLGESAEEIMSGPIYWVTRLSLLALAPTKGWYLHMPTFVNVFAPVFVAVFSVTTSVSGRAAALGSFCFAALVVIGGKTRRRMGVISRHFWAFCIVGVLVVCALYGAYKFSARQGWLGERSRLKYEQQTHGGQGGIIGLILGGRGDSFIGLLACRDRPIIGWGPWPNDQNGYTEEFMVRFGTLEDQDKLRETLGYQSRMLMQTGRIGLSCHAYITEFWAWYGIAGLIFILYAVFVMIRYLKEDVSVVPQWYAWLACSLPGVFWAVFFSPFAERFGFPRMIVGCLMARAVRLGRFQLPADMIREIAKAEGR